ncbi:helix-turn-helix domain-containing protein [Pontimicrobium sp. IMCC45349]|uniref:helix-turn-helix domain-containing protein n=1 Tax=Pontimicrobium sp. IMCC45349 TaxID=3391574 RepID=UPI00399F0A91
MNSEKITLTDIKKLRLERHWSQEQLAEMSGLSTRTIQRIESGQKAGFESLKALAAVFEKEIVEESLVNINKDDDEKKVYINSIKGLYKLLAVAGFCILGTLFMAITTSNWFFFWLSVITWVIIIGVYMLNMGLLLGANWKQKAIDKKFKKE